MKRLLLLTWLILTVLKLEAQSDKRHSFGANYSYGKALYTKGTYKSFNSKNYEGKDYFSLGLDYTYSTSETTDVGIGIAGTVVSLGLKNSFMTQGGSSEGYYEETLSILSVPIYLKYHFGKYFFLAPGLSFNYHHSHGYTWGVGGFAGVGFEYTLFPNIILSIATQLQFNILSSGKRDSDDFNFSGFQDKMSLIGGKIAIGYCF